ncbi:MAG: MBOAT family O-acyltransferase [Eubacteriales bacterium]|nr:MBOAT family O-acyltransferase [Eubacteriales bacterium]
MLFNSYLFIFAFLPLLLAGWYFLNRKKRFRLAQGYLIGMSLWFYAYVNLSYLWILLVSCLAGWLLSLLPERLTQRGRRLLIAAGCVLHLGLLGYFKYSNFFLENVNALLGTDFVLTHVILPVGISFYTFQQLAYLIDRCRGEAPGDSFFDYLTFMVYFPQLLQGPILLREELIPQLHDLSRRRFDAGRFALGIQYFVLGLAKKVLLADTLAGAVNFGYENAALLDSPSAVLLAAGYLTELYFDFSGYCDMAVGLGKMVGIEVAQNFDSPFRSGSVREFWRRWHITLGRFFTRYVYIPLGGSRRGKVRTLCNVMIVMLLSGLWHGAAWTFVLWGFLHGLGMIWDNIKRRELPHRWMNRLLTFAYVCLTFVFFRADSIGQGFLVIRKMVAFSWNGFLLQMAQALELKEFYIVDKALSMKFPALLPWFWLVVLLALTALCIRLVCGENTDGLVRRHAAKLAALSAEDVDKIVKKPISTVEVGDKSVDKSNGCVDRPVGHVEIPGDRKSRRNVDRVEKGWAILLAFLFAWSVISMTGVSEYLYFTF